MLRSHVTVANLDGENSGLENEKHCGLVVDPTTRYERGREGRGRSGGKWRTEGRREWRGKGTGRERGRERVRYMVDWMLEYG